MHPRLAVIGATGAVGTLVRQLLAEREFPFQSIRFFGSPGSGRSREISFRDANFEVEPLERARIQDIDLAISSTPDAAALEFVPWVVEQGGMAVDESAAHRMDVDVPLVVPEVNPHAVAKHQGIIASPNCTTIQLVVCLKPLLQLAEIRRVIVSTYQAASGAGEFAREDFVQSALRGFSGGSFESRAFERQLANSLIPKIGGVSEMGSTSEELKIVRETQKILERNDLPISATCVRVPVEHCHGESVIVDFDRAVTADMAREAFQKASGIELLDDAESCDFPMPANCRGRDEVFIGRIRKDYSGEHSIAFWSVSDNLRKGAATNAVQIAELLVK